MTTLASISVIILMTIFFSNVHGGEAIYIGSFSYVKGQVTLEPKKTKARQNALKEMPFSEGDKIATHNNSLAILSLQDGSTIKVGPNSELTVISLLGKNEQEYFGISRLMLAIGGVMVDVVKKFTGPPSVEIVTTKGIAFGVRGTKFYTFIETDSDDTWTVVREGEVQAYDFAHDDSEIIPAGTALVAIEGERLTIPQEYLWAKKISWDSEDSGILTSANERKSELAQVLTKVLNRRRKPFMNTDSNPRKIQDRTPRQIKEMKIEESTDPLPLKSSGPLQKSLAPKIEQLLKTIGQKHPHAPKPIQVEEHEGGNIALQACTKVAPSGFPCIVRQGQCFGEEVSAAIFYSNEHVYNACVKIINGAFL